jgi:hypothetical protein
MQNKINAVRKISEPILRVCGCVGRNLNNVTTSFDLSQMLILMSF